jgi:uncharacterized OsmC-like protein
MLLHIIADDHIRLELDGGEGLDIHGGPFGSLQMLATSLALCTASVLHDYATTAQFHLHDLAIDVRWRYAEHPYRAADYRMTLLIGPDVPPSRHRAILRAAEQCTVHNTLTHGARVETTLEVPGAQQA